ncbi:hypothetical protein BpHYR1_013976 [Brachionus plicatilis]|uniref:Uncharacterized protein n=1 Tax=Brachionus plicatilis TaxID=10195 RepID=A0A3M7SS83_BRAPC|nr:hypothetical protein BpHYR1_013976 [Brachionus plicatilis]
MINSKILNRKHWPFFLHLKKFKLILITLIYSKQPCSDDLLSEAIHGSYFTLAIGKKLVCGCLGHFEWRWCS